MTWFLERLKEKTTWAALLAGVSSISGYAFAPELAEYITQAGLALVGIVAFFTAEDK